MSAYIIPVTFRRSAFLDGTAGASRRRRAGALSALANVPLGLLRRPRPAAAGFGSISSRPAMPGCLREFAARG